jgi:hypothetical protein
MELVLLPIKMSDIHQQTLRPGIAPKAQHEENVLLPYSTHWNF